MRIRYKYRMPLHDDYKLAWIKLAIYLAVIALIVFLGNQVANQALRERFGTILILHSSVMGLDSLLVMIGRKVSPGRPFFLNYLLPMQDPAGSLMIIDLIILIVFIISLFNVIF